MKQLSRRQVLVTAAGGAVVISGCSDITNGEDNDVEEETLVNRTFTASDINPEIIQLSTEPDSALIVDMDADEPAILNVVEEETGTPVVTLGEGIAYTNRNRVEGVPTPDSSTQFVLCLASQSEARFDVEVKASHGVNADAETPDATSLNEQMTTVDTELETTNADRAAKTVGPLWAQLLSAQAEEVNATIDPERLDSLQQTAFGSAAVFGARDWVDQRIDLIAGALATAAVTAVSAKTGLPAGILEDSLEDEIQTALSGDSVEWLFRDAMPQQLDPSGGELTVVTDLVLDLTVEAVGVEVLVPMEFDVEAQAETIPISTAVNKFDILTDQIVVE